jgi:hypothetical protein
MRSYGINRSTQTRHRHRAQSWLTHRRNINAANGQLSRWLPLATTSIVP